ncbi:MAG: bifunctional phosphoribosylaminoimidazolecarboxamide formyltransferase/IMP cyclohydrolase [SAR202 cluster bacterium]|jgi:phosphoribosylaminoimidazolecarboxamide formyltransferase/IMP cyclohydrolase|nr:bifunctional phosphoribosylaminoimidazolecarboxamide formyltransferase/IMP cyclohydrolase [SAR202 cluster bacterium]
MKALLSVYDKTGIAEFARALRDSGFDLVSTGGTYGAIKDAGLPVQQVSDLTGSPEILDGRVKTLHPTVHGGILARRDIDSHVAQLAERGIDAIDLVAVNLYPFVETVGRPGVILEEALENIDIGGPTMVRAAAKNFPHVLVVVDPADYGWIGERLSNGGNDSLATVTLGERKNLARKAFQHVAYYDTAITGYLGGGGLSGNEVTLGFTKQYDLRYGENPHQQAAVYAAPLATEGIAGAKQLHGKELSFNNFLDADAAWRVVSDFSEPAATVVKHTNPCGLAVHTDQPTAYRRAFEGDSTSAYGGIVGFNRPLTAATAEAMRGVFYEIVVAPQYEPEALEVLRKRKNLRVLQVHGEGEPSAAATDVRLISGGALFQTADVIDEEPSSWKAVTERKPTEAERKDLAFAWKAAKHIKSNAIVVIKDNALVGMGAGQPNRVNSVHLSLRLAGDKAEGGVLASDAFFPFADNIELAASGGVTAIAQPGGSIRDDEVIEAANRLKIAMVFTGTRHFRH